MIYNRIEHKYSLRPVNYVIKSGLIVLCLFVCYPIFACSHHLCSNKNVSSSDAVVNAFLNKIKSNQLNKSVQIKRIVIDPGHGGKDHGCGGYHSNEKHIVLDIAKRVKAKLREYHPELEVIMTREHDIFIPLYKRIEIANRNNADLFISIHCNSLEIKSVRGTETYVMGLHTAAENLAVAKRENDAILLEHDYINNYDGYDPNSDEGHIMLAMSQNQHLIKSINFANKIERSIAKRTKLKSRGVKQAGFVVLKRATMPSVLIETGFISNQQDENYLMSKEGKSSMADAIVKAFTLYKRELDEEQNDYNDLSIAASNSQRNKQEIPAQYSAPKPNVDKPIRKVKSSEINDPNHHKIISVSTSSPSQGRITSIVKKENPRPVDVVTFTGKMYKVQIAASINKPITQKSAMWQEVHDITIKQEDNMYKYLTGSFATRDEANVAKSKMRTLGFKGAFVVAYLGEDRVNL